MSDIETLHDMMIALLAREPSVTREFIRDNVNRFAEPFGEGITSVEKEALIKRLVRIPLDLGQSFRCIPATDSA